MGQRGNVVLLSALAAMTSLHVLACRKRAPDDSHSRDASSKSGDASAEGGSLAELDAATLPVAPAAPTPAPAPTTTELAALQPPPMPFTGTYRCFGGMKLEQSGRIVTSTIHKGTTDTVLACTAGIDTCTGTVREIQMLSGRPPKVMHVKPVTLTRLSGGDVVYVVGSSERKAARGDQTLCQRR